MRDINNFSTPINKTAALVVQQPKENDLDQIAEKIKTLTDALPQWQKLAAGGDVEAKAKVTEINEERKALGRKKKIIKAALSEKMESYIVRECRKRFDSDTWSLIIHSARQQWAKELDGEL